LRIDLLIDARLDTGHRWVVGRRGGSREGGRGRSLNFHQGPL